jgi:hypothetical protein
MLQRIIRIQLRTHIRFGTAKSTIPRVALQLKIRIYNFDPQIENYYKLLTDRIKNILQPIPRKDLMKLDVTEKNSHSIKNAYTVGKSKIYDSSLCSSIQNMNLLFSSSN